MLRRPFILALLVIVTLPFVLNRSVATAQDATPIADGPPLPDGCAVVADRLTNPRHLAIAEDGTIYVTEAGAGGDEVLPPPSGAVGGGTPQAAVSEASTPGPEAGAPPPTRGMTGQITAILPDGAQSVVASGLPSYSEGIGPTGIVLVDDDLYVAIGGAAAILGVEPLPNENWIVQIDPTTGDVTPVADVGALELADNPDDTDVNPNLYGLDLGADDQLYVADAGGNTVFKIDPATGTVTLLGIVAERSLTLELPSPATPDPDAPSSLQAVPTALHVGADGNVYVGILGALVPGGGGIQIAQANGTFRDAATGLTAVVGVSLGPDGALYASQLTTNIAADVPQPGNVVRIGADGTAATVVDDLVFPHGIAFDADGNLYVIVNSVAFGPGAPQGQVLRCNAIAA